MFLSVWFGHLSKAVNNQSTIEFITLKQKVPLVKFCENFRPRYLYLAIVNYTRLLSVL